MVGYSFAVRSSIRSLVLEFGLALTCVVLYYALFSLCKQMGETRALPPLVAAWFTNVAFIALLIWRYVELERVPRS